MIYDTLQNLHFYERVNDKLHFVQVFVDQNQLANLSDGRYDLEDGVYAMVGTHIVRTEGQYEAHRKYADLQLILEGDEIIEYAHLSEMTHASAYDAKGDSILFDCAPQNRICLKMTPMRFAILFPEDAHKPLMALNSRKSRKIIFKLPL